MCWSYFEGAASSLGNLRRGCRPHFLPVSPSLLSLPHTIHSLEEPKTCVLATSRYFRKHTVTQPVYKDLHGYSRWLVFGLFFLSFFFLKQPRQLSTTVGTEVLLLSLSPPQCLHPFSLPTHPDCPVTRTAPRQPALAAVRFSVPACLLALLRCQLHLRAASQPGI